MISSVNCRSPFNKMFRYRQLVIITLILVFGDSFKSVMCSQSIVPFNNNNRSQVESLKNSNFLVGIADYAVNTVNESNQVQVLTCVGQLDSFLDAVEVNEIWSIKLIDSFGNIPKSFIWGNTFWFSSKELCTDIYNPFQISQSPKFERSSDVNLMNASSPFRMHLQMVYFNYSTSMQLDLKQTFRPHLSIGLCIPEVCPEEDVAKWASQYFAQTNFIPQRILDIQMTPANTKVLGYSTDIFKSPGTILLIFFGAVAIILSILAEVADKLRNRRLEVSKNNSSETFFAETFLTCFSIRQNFPRVLDSSSPKDFVTVIAGMRTIACLWITLFHIFYHSMFTRNNVQFLYAKLETIIFQPVLAACFYVDVFFTISGFLLAYNLLSNVQHVEKIKSNSMLANTKLYLQFACHRHLRLMPIFIVTMIVSDFFYDFLDMASPFYMNADNDLYCKENWWYNLFYLNNGRPFSRMCVTWGWYIACEMQFYLFFLAILFVYIRSSTNGKTIYSLALLGFLSASYYCYFTNDITFQLDVVSNTLDNVYTKPWTRITPYFSGIFMGWLLYRAKDSTLKFGKLFLMSFWVLSGLIYFITVTMTYWKETPVWVVAWIMSFGKLFFGIFIGCLICVCQLGYGGIFASIMGSKIFLYLHKFSFSMYMIAPIVISVLFGLRTEASHFDELTAGSDIIALLIVSHFCAVLVTFFIEIPFQRISSRYILRRV